MAAQNPANYDTIFYRVRAGDSLGRIIQRYHGSVTTLQRNAIISQIQADNSGLTNPNRIVPNQLIQMNVPQKYCSASTHPDSTPALSLGEPYYKPLVRQWDFAAPQEKEMLATLTPIMLGTGAASMTMIQRTFTANAPLLNEMVQNYEAYKAGNLSKGQYDYRRYKILTRIKAKLGPLSRMLNASRLQREVLRISRTRGSVPTGNITRQIGRMGRLSKYASRGGVVLSAVGLGLACNEIANTDDTQKKNEILVESVGGTLGGAFAGVAILIMFTPAGWVGALVVGVGGAVAGYASGKGFRKLYDTHGRKVDVASATGITRLCSK